MEQLQSILTDLDNKAITKHQAYDLILVLFDVSNSACSCRPNTDLYCKTITYCNKCHKEVKVVRTN